jgi:hypothetical protein
VGNFPAAQPVTDNGGSLTVDGTVAVSNFPAAGLTDAELRASPVDVNATLGESVTVDEDREVQKVSNVTKTFFDDFPGAAIDSTKWDVITNTGSPTIAVTSSELRITTTTGGTQEYLLRSKEMFRLPAKFIGSFRMATAGTNQVFYVELVSVNPGTGLPDGLSAISIYSENTTSFFRFRTTADGTNFTPTNAIGNGTGSTTTSYEWVALPDLMTGMSRVFNDNTPLGGVAQYSGNLPDPTATYKLQIRAVNNVTSAGALFAVGRVTLQELNPIQTITDLARGTGINSTGNATPVTLTGSLAVQQSSGSSSTPWYMRSYIAVGSSSTSTLGAGATYTGAATNGNVTTAAITTVRVIVRHTGATLGTGTLVLEESTDTSTYREVARFPVPNDGTYRSYSFAPGGAGDFWRMKFINGAVAQSAFYIKPALISEGGAKTMPVGALHYAETTTALAGGATWTGIPLDLGMNPFYTTQRAFVYADQAGTLNLQQSRDGTNWRTVKSQAVAAGETWTVESPIALSYCRLQYVNGGTLQGAFELYQTLVPLS